MRHVRLKKEDVLEDFATVKESSLGMEFSAGVSNEIFIYSIVKWN